MTRRRPPPDPKLIRGRLSDFECSEIERLSSSMKNPTPGKVALLLNRHPATVNHHMLREGLIERKPARPIAPFMRKGVVIHPYTGDHDVFIEQLSTAGLGVSEIARRATEEFHIPRTSGSIQMRLAQLAAIPDEFARPGSLGTLPVSPPQRGGAA